MRDIEMLFELRASKKTRPTPFIEPTGKGRESVALATDFGGAFLGEPCRVNNGRVWPIQDPL